MPQALGSPAMAGAESRIDTATVLFTDLVGSTALRSRIGEEAADQLRVKHDALISDAIVVNRGLVVKHTGDGVMATFSAAVDAVAAAVAIQQAVDGHNRRSADERMEVRVGISVGDVTFEGDDCFGLPVIEAQRLEAAADGGQILCAEIVRHLARGRGGHEFDSVGELDLKGIPDPVPAVAVLWDPVVQVEMPRETPLPAVLAAPSGFDLAGRADELATMVDAWKESAEGRRKVMLISGEPGIGKTRLATETALVARHQGGLVLGGRCDEELALPYQPFAEALRFQSELDDVPAAWLGPFAGELARLVPDLARPRPGIEGAGPGRPGGRAGPPVRGGHDVAAHDRGVGPGDARARRPALGRQADAASSCATSCTRPSQDSLLIVGTYRSTDLDRAHPLAAMLADLRRDGSVTRLALDGLTNDGVAELLERSAGHDLDDAGVALGRRGVRRDRGQPVLRRRDRAPPGREPGARPARRPLDERPHPRRRRAARGRPRGRRPPDLATRRGHAEAPVGRGGDGPGVRARRCSRWSPGSTRTGRWTCSTRRVATSLINEVGLDRYRFGHALVRATLLEELTTTRRVRTHRKIARSDRGAARQ